MRIHKHPGLYTRQQIATMTGIDDSTLNYWAREGVLRAVGGGGGKGQHRRFSFEQINLAAILERLRRYGVRIGSLRQVAEMFNGAVDYFADFEWAEDETETIWTLMNDRSQFTREGYLTRFVVNSEPDQWPNHEKFPTGQWTSEVRLTWDEQVAWWRSGNSGDTFTDEIVAYVEGQDAPEWMRQNRLYSIVTSIPPKLYEGSEAEYFYVTDDGRWHVSANTDAAHRGEADTFIAMELTVMFYRLWHPERASTGAE